MGIYINGNVQKTVTITATSRRIYPGSSTIVWDVSSSSGTFSYNFSAGTTYVANCSSSNTNYSDSSDIYVTIPVNYSGGSIGIGCKTIGSGQTIIGVKKPSIGYPIQIGAEGIPYAQISSRTSGWTTVSDMRDKIDFQNIDNALLFVNNLKPVRYMNNEREKYMDTNGNIDNDLYNRAIYRGKRRQVGFIAQEVYETMKKVYNNDNYADIVDYSNYQISEEKDMNFDRYSMRYNSLIPFLTGAIQELSKEIDALKATIAELKSQSINQ